MRVRILAVLLLWLAIAFGTGPARADEAGGPDRGIVMAVRADAPPFAWRDPGAGIFRGFLYDLCVAAVARTDFYIEAKIPVLPKERDAIFEGRAPRVDLLCDPTTISLSRLRDFAAAGLEFSPIVFVANGSYVVNSDSTKGLIAGPRNHIAGCLEPSGSATSAGAAARSPPRYLRAGFVSGTTGEATLRSAIRDRALPLAAGERVCPEVLASHWEAARAFCRGELHYYFGDEDILRSALALEKADGDGCAPAEVAPNPLSYEPYAFVLSNRTPGFRLAFETALYEVFLTGKAEHDFAEHFPGRSMSAFLKTLFRINSIPPGERANLTASRAEALPAGATRRLVSYETLMNQ